MAVSGYSSVFCVLAGLQLVLLVDCLEVFDTLQPIVKISPDQSEREDRFGFSITLHRKVDVDPSDPYDVALNKTSILVGAPYGKFIGGSFGLEYGYLACAEEMDTTNQTILMATTQEERANCLANLTTGLVYDCNLYSDDCGPITGNGDPKSVDGYLFERSGNNPDIRVDDKTHEEDKNNQQMGFSIHSGNGFFVACAPTWKYVNTEGGIKFPQPRGICVYSDRSLEGFTILLICITSNNLNTFQGGFCTTGIAGMDTKAGVNNVAELALGTPGRFRSRGGMAYYSNLANMTLLAGNNYRDANVNPAVGDRDTAGRRFVNTPLGSNQVAYYGFAFTSGNFLRDQNISQFVSSGPRFSSDDEITGAIFIQTDLTYKSSPDNISLEGEQFGESFGWSIAAADFDQDGFDDLAVGAPFYFERSRPELGRIYVFQNNQTDGFKNATKIVGYESHGRYGISLAVLGDVNNDGYPDLAVGAPYEGSGVVYIYHGQAADETGAIINPQYAQRIDGASMVSRVENISEVRMFGYSLSASIDIDNNEYNDLAVGAFGTKSVFVFRARPLASVVTNITTVDEVTLDAYNCRLGGRPITCFDVTVCAEYTGKSIANQFSTKVRVLETSTPQRIQFPEPTSSIGTAVITFNGENMKACATVTAYVRNDTTSLDPIVFSGEVLPIERPDIVISTNSNPPDLSELPILDTRLETAMVRVFAECGSDDVCTSDLALELNSVNYVSQTGEPTADQENLVIDDAQRLTLVIDYFNTGEDAFNSFVTFSIPKQYFTFDTALLGMLRVSCMQTDDSNDEYDVRRCTVRTPLSRSNGRLQLSIRMAIGSLTGDEGTLSIPISINIGENSTRNNESNLLNNDITVPISVVARTRYTVSVSFDSRISYQGNHTPSVNNEASNLGSQLLLTATLRNEGPSTIQNAILTLYIPTRSEATGDYFFYYPAKLTTSLSNTQCTMEGINPSGFRVTTSRRRRSRSRSRRHADIFRVLRQTTDTLDVDCRGDPSSCVMVTCNITNLGRSSADVVITGFLDERFYYRKEDTYRLRAYAEGQVLDEFLQTNGSETFNNFTISISEQSLPSTSSSTPPWYVIALPIFGAIIFLVALAVALYFFGFFRRKKTDGGAAGEDEFDQFDANPFGAGGKPPAGAGGPPGGGASLGDPELMKYEQKKKESEM